MTIALLVYITALLEPLTMFLGFIAVFCVVGCFMSSMWAVDTGRSAIKLIKKLAWIGAITATTAVILPTQTTAWLMVGGYAAQTAYQSEEGVKYRKLLLDKVESVLTQDKNKGDNTSNANK